MKIIFLFKQVFQSAIFIYEKKNFIAIFHIYFLILIEKKHELESKIFKWLLKFLFMFTYLETILGLRLNYLIVIFRIFVLFPNTR